MNKKSDFLLFQSKLGIDEYIYVTQEYYSLRKESRKGIKIIETIILNRIMDLPILNSMIVNDRNSTLRKFYYDFNKMNLKKVLRNLGEQLRKANPNVYEYFQNMRKNTIEQESSSEEDIEEIDEFKIIVDEVKESTNEKLEIKQDSTYLQVPQIQFENKKKKNSNELGSYRNMDGSLYDVSILNMETCMNAVNHLLKVSFTNETWQEYKNFTKFSIENGLCLEEANKLFPWKLVKITPMFIYILYLECILIDEKSIHNYMTLYGKNYYKEEIYLFELLRQIKFGTALINNKQVEDNIMSYIVKTCNFTDSEIKRNVLFLENIVTFNSVNYQENDKLFYKVMNEVVKYKDIYHFIKENIILAQKLVEKFTGDNVFYFMERYIALSYSSNIPLLKSVYELAKMDTKQIEIFFLDIRKEANVCMESEILKLIDYDPLLMNVCHELIYSSRNKSRLKILSMLSEAVKKPGFKNIRPCKGNGKENIKLLENFLKQDFMYQNSPTFDIQLPPTNIDSFYLQ
jgi:hypothetical protein